MKLDKKNLILYAITDRKWADNTEIFYKQIEDSLKGGATILQLREKSLDKKNLFIEAKNIKKICEKYSVPFIINDNVELAAEIDADGIHIGQDDMPLVDAKKLIGDEKIIGVTVQTVEDAILAEKNGASYLGVGAIFPTDSKNDAAVIEINELKKICSSVSIPVVAIGGIKSENISVLSGCGISGIAVISAIYSQKDIFSATKQLRP